MRGSCLLTAGDIWCKGDGAAEGERCKGRQRGNSDGERDREGENPRGTVKLLVEPV
jgi:hypothetical protein